MLSHTLVPERLLSRMVAETVFDEAYGAVPDARRAWLKTCIACLCARYGERRASLETHFFLSAAGFACRTRASFLEWGVLFLGGEDVSAPCALAALLPLRLAGAGEVVVARVRAKGVKAGAWPAPLLTGLELAGQETVLDLSSGQARFLLDSLDAEKGRGAALFLGGGEETASLRARCASAAGVFSWSGRLPAEIGVWNVPPCFDLEVLSWAHPEAALRVWGEDETNGGEGPGGFEAFLDQGCEVLCVPPGRTGEALERAGTVIGPGGEGCWIWPDLSPDLFRDRGAAWDYVHGKETAGGA